MSQKSLEEQLKWGERGEFDIHHRTVYTGIDPVVKTDVEGDTPLGLQSGGMALGHNINTVKLKSAVGLDYLELNVGTFLVLNDTTDLQLNQAGIFISGLPVNAYNMQKYRTTHPKRF